MQSKPPRVTSKPTIRRLSETNNVRKEFFEPAEFAAVVSALPEYLQDVARSAYLTGWRRGDMLGLRWTAVDMERGVIRLYRGETKNDEGRTLAIAGPLIEIMARREARLVERCACGSSGAACGAGGVMAWERGAGKGARGRGGR